MGTGTSQPNLRNEFAARPRAALYVDESYTQPRWMYIGVLAVPEGDVDALARDLQGAREATGYANEMHFSEITTAQKSALASRWLECTMHPGPPRICFHVLGVDLSRVNRASFGVRSREQRQGIYRRALRMAAKYAIKSYLPDQCIVTGVFHDARSVAGDEYFERGVPALLRDEDGLNVAASRITLIDSDHTRSGAPEKSTFIQLIDVILGATRTCLDAASEREHIVRSARVWLPMMERLAVEGSRNPGSRFGYVGRCSVSFFPKEALSIDQIQNGEPRSSDFYRGRPLLLAERNSPRLFDD